MLAIRDLTVEYASGQDVVRPLDGFSTAVPAGALALLLGPSGCGKSTLLACIAGLQRPAAGSITFGTTEVTTLDPAGRLGFRRHTCGVVFQAFNLIPSLRAVENVLQPLRAAGVPARQARARAEELLARVGLADRAHHRPGQLSGGQQQRVAIARALALDPPLLLADEPTAHLDYVQVEGVLQLLAELVADGRVVVIATHDDRLLPLATQVIDLVPRPPELTAQVIRVQLNPGEVLFSQGDPADRIFIVEDGAVELVRRQDPGGERRLAVRGPGEHFGEMGPLFRLPRSATARAVGAAVLRGYSLEGFRATFGIERLESLLPVQRSSQPRLPVFDREVPDVPLGPPSGGGALETMEYRPREP